MKRQLSHANIFNLKLIGAVAGTMGVVFYPLVASANTNSSESEQNNQKNSTLSATGNKASKASRKYNRSRKLIEALEAVNKHKNQTKKLIALNKASDKNTNLPSNLQRLVEERDYAAEYILTALKTSEDTNNNLPSSLRKLVDERNNAVENTLVALKPIKVTDTKLSLVQKLKVRRNQIANSKEELIALEPYVSTEKLLEEDNTNPESQGVASITQSKIIKLEEAEYNASLQNTLLSIDIGEDLSNSLQKIDEKGNYLLALEPFIEEQKPVESSINSTSEGNYLLALEPFLQEQKPAEFPINSTSGNYLLALEPFLQEQKPVEFPINSTNGNYLLALEPFLNEQKPAEFPINFTSKGNYLLALEPFLNEQKPVEFPINSTNGNYLLALEPFLQEQKPAEFPINSTSEGNYLLALEPFLQEQKPAEFPTKNTSENKTDVTQWFSQLVAINVFESTPKNQIPENTPTLIAKNWTTDNLSKRNYSFTSLIAIQPSSFTDNYDNNSSEIKLAAEYNSFNSRDNQNQELNSNNILASYSKSPFGLPQPENLNPNFTPVSNQYISQFPQNNNNSKVVILSPTPDAIVDVAATPIILQFLVGNQVELRVNGELSDRSLIGRTETDSETDLVTQTWYGVSLQNGENIISAQIIGSKEPPVTVKIMVRGGADEIKLNTVESRIPADGISTATIKGTLLDENGNISNRDAVVTLASTAGKFLEPDYKPGQPGFQVQAKGGQFTATLKSDLEAKTVRIRGKVGKLEAFTQLQFKTALRPSLMTGVIDFRLGARGTDFYSRFKDFLPEDEDNDTEVKFRSAVFATGAIGEWLVTGAYDSSRSLNEDCNCDNRLFGTYQFSEENYPTYGDSSTVNKITPSTDSVYLRLERSSRTLGADPDYAMWGDYNTQEFSRSSQQFTSLTRQLHGFKANYNIGKLQATAFYGNNVEGFQRDTIAPDGTSGFYFVSRRLLVPGSESVFIELEELNRPGTVLQRERLSRGPDYEIDYDRGTVLFREPILRTDVNEFGEVLVRRIVVTYQYEGDEAGDDTDIYAGRLQYNFARSANKDSWLAATYVQENQGDRDFELYGADAQFTFGKLGKIIAEFARSRNDSGEMGMVEGDAVRAEAEAEFIKGLRARAYYRFADTGFANNATISFVPGQTRYGAQVNGRVTKTTNLRFQYDREHNFGIAPQPLDTFEELFSPRTTAIPGNPVDNSLTTISAGIVQKFGKASLSVDWIQREREDRITPETLNTDSSQLRSRLNVPIAKKLSFVAQNETTLSDQTDAVYPDRTVFGLNWEAIPGINLSLTQQFYTQGQFDGNSITSLNVNGEHKFGEDTTVTGRFSVLGGSNGPTTQGALGLKQGVSIAPGLRLNLAYERVFGDFFGNNGTGQQFRQPFAVGQSAAALGFNSGDSYSVGLEYTDNPNFKASALFERRNSTSGNNTVISAGATGKLSSSLTALARYQQAGSSNQTLGALGDTANLRVGLAYRNPKNDKFNALMRYEYRKNPSTIPETILFGTGTGAEDHTFALEAIYAPNWQWEFYGKYALRNSTTYLADDFSSSSNTNLGQLRATYRLGYSWDLVGEARVITQSDYTETGFVVEAGYYLTPNLRIAGGYAFGDIDDRDFDGSRSASGPYLGVTMKLNQLFSGFGLQKRTPRREIEERQTLLNKLKQGTENGENLTPQPPSLQGNGENLKPLSWKERGLERGFSDIKKSPLGTLAEKIKKVNQAKKVEKTLLQRLTTGKRR
jgi:hypothetical protein